MLYPVEQGGQIQLEAVVVGNITLGETQFFDQTLAEHFAELALENLTVRELVVFSRVLVELNGHVTFVLTRILGRLDDHGHVVKSEYGIQVDAHNQNVDSGELKCSAGVSLDVFKDDFDHIVGPFFYSGIDDCGAVGDDLFENLVVLVANGVVLGVGGLTFDVVKLLVFHD